MNLNAVPLTLVSFARPGADAGVNAALGRLGYRPRVLTPERLGEGLQGVRRGAQAGALVLLMGAQPESRARILAALDRTHPWPTLGIMTGEGANWDPEVAGRCCDCVRWPCAEDELAFRLGRLCPDLPAGGVDQALWDLLAQVNLVGRSPAFLAAMDQVRRMMDSTAPVLIEGETGTGKELVAQAIHYLGPRAAGPFVPVNCGALPDHLVENELFGHERGAYTDARAPAPGAIGEAAGGTLFLDEVEALSPKAQAALLRFLQDREYRPLGAGRALRSDARVVAASNADLRALGAERRFRPDLYFRLDILSVTLPPLRARAGDIEVLANHFVEVYCRQYGLGPKRLAPRSLAALHAHSWPGNVRELESLIHRSVVMAEGPQLHLAPRGAEWGSPEPEPTADSAHWAALYLASAAQPRRADDQVGDGDADPAHDLGSQGFAEAKARAIGSFERAYLTRLMAETSGNVSRAARVAGKERRALGKLLKKYGIRTAGGDQAE